MQSQIMCSGCRSLLLYPRGASNVCCALCNTITPVPAPPPDEGKSSNPMALTVGGFCSHQCLNPISLFLPSISSNPLLLSLLPPFHTSLLGAKLVSSAHHIKLKHSPKSAAEEVSGELTEDPKFVPLNADDPVYGPPALLLLGFEVEEAVKIRQFLKEFDGEFLQVIFCTEDMIPQSLWDAVHTSQPNLESVKIAKSLPRICFLSGLTGEEMMMFIDAFPETGLEPAVFAALVPNSADKPLEELIDEIMGDHEMMTAKEHSSTKVEAEPTGR